MDDTIRRAVLDLLDKNRIMSIATVRPDGWPQATTVGYSHEGLTLYFLCASDSQKATNIAADNRVSLTINSDVDQMMDIRGLSMAAHAEPVEDVAEKQRFLDRLVAAYPPQENLQMQLPPLEAIHVMKLTPVVISLIDYTKGFGHTDLVTC